jgi:hypothetical protein
MKTAVIKTEKYLFVVSDEKIKVNDLTYDGEGIYKWTNEDVEDCLYNPGGTDNKGCSKIIAYLPLDGAPYLEDVELMKEK